MTNYWNYEFKETIRKNGCFLPPDPPTNCPSETDIIIGICYYDNFPDHLEIPDEAYQRALKAKYYIWKNYKWRLINNNGNAIDFLILLQQKQGHKFRVSFPDPFDNYKKFDNSTCNYIYPIYPFRELIRRNFEPLAYISDRDMIIHKTYIKCKGNSNG